MFRWYPQYLIYEKVLIKFVLNKPNRKSENLGSIVGTNQLYNISQVISGAWALW